MRGTWENPAGRANRFRPLSVSLTTRDLIDAHDAATSATSGLRPAFRVPLIALGLLWASGPLLAIAFPERARWSIGAVVIWLAGCWIAWQHLAQPWIESRRIARRGGEDRFTVEADDSGLAVTRDALPGDPWRWTTIATTYRNRRGVLITTWGGATLWLPVRVFAHTAEMRAFDSFIRARTTPQRLSGQVRGLMLGIPFCMGALAFAIALALHAMALAVLIAFATIVGTVLSYVVCIKFVEPWIVRRHAAPTAPADESVARER